MIGSVIGDIVGSVFEVSIIPIKFKDFPFYCEYDSYTDDTVLSVAVADALLEGSGDDERSGRYVNSFHEWFALYPEAGFGETFFQWARSRCREPYNSWGNGSAMRVGPVGWAFESLDETLAEARRPWLPPYTRLGTAQTSQPSSS